MKKALVLAMIFLLTLSFASCKGENASTGGEVTGAPVTSSPVTSAPAPSGLLLSDYRIVRRDSSGADIMNAVKSLKNTLLDITALDLTVSTDFTDRDDNSEILEILVGDTNRAESAAALEELSALEDKNILIRLDKNKIVIVGKDDKSLVMALKHFVSEFVEKSEAMGRINLEEGKPYTANDSCDYILENGTALTVESYEYLAKGRKGIVTYPSLLRLEHNKNKGKNGIMFVSFKGDSGFNIYASYDDAQTWTKNPVSTVRAAYDNYVCQWNPVLYELPIDIGEYKAGTILFSATAMDKAGEDFTKSAMPVFVSEDLCRSWTMLPHITYGGSLTDQAGVWEPFFIGEEETGRLYCFYSDDTLCKTGQRIAYQYTEDLVTWSERKHCVAFEDEQMRPGMASIAKMDNGQYILTYEVYKWHKPDGPVYYKTASSLDSWDADDIGTQVKLKDGSSIQGAPWVAYTSSGGERGLLFIVGARPLPDDDMNGYCVYVSTDYGKSFKPIENPIPKEYDKENQKHIDNYMRFGYSPSIIFSSDGKYMFYANNKADGDSAFAMVVTRIRISE